MGKIISKNEVEEIKELKKTGEKDCSLSRSL